MPKKTKFPYRVGKYITLHLKDGLRTRAKIVRVLSITLSCVVLVRIDGDNIHGQYILKLYDRRFAKQLRRDEDASSWNERIERKYRALVKTEKMSLLFKDWSQRLRGDYYSEDKTREDWDNAQLEAYLQFLCWKAYTTETHAYALMTGMQKIHVPKLVSEVEVVSPIPRRSVSKAGHLGEYTKRRGILLQYINGFPLTDLANEAPRKHWQRICADAIDIVLQIGERGICNRDVRPRNFIVSRPAKRQKYRVFMIDFGLCVFRDEARDVQEFEQWQADQDEEGAIGYVMEKKLKGGFKYSPSARSQRLLDEYKSEYD